MNFTETFFLLLFNRLIYKKKKSIKGLNSASPSGKVSLINRTPNCNQNDICLGDTSPSVTLRTSHLSQSYPFQCETLPKSPQCPSKIPSKFITLSVSLFESFELLYVLK